MGGYFSSSGSYFSWYNQEQENPDEDTAAFSTGSNSNTGNNSDRKRKAEDESQSKSDDDSFLRTPKKKKMKTTTEYIYQVLFIDGENSDITITALGKEWRLHKLYLRQCGFFESMFSGSWKETEATSVTLDIPDDNIDADALTVAFGCLYRDDLTIEPVQVIPVLASASLLQLDGLMQQCAVIMKETISTKTVCEYYECSVLYGLRNVEAACFEWFENNIMCKQSRNLLKLISPNLMQSLVNSPNLFVMQVEMDVYNLLKRWLFLQLVPSWNGSFKSGLTKQAENHFKDIIKQEFGVASQHTFLETSQGIRYRPVFANLRMQHIVIDLTSTQLLIKDRIIPTAWLTPYFKSNWLTLLTIEQGEDNGPKVEDVDHDVFLNTSLRCARVLSKEAEYQWRWIGFNFGIDLVVMYANRLVIFKRNCTNQSRLLTNQPHRQFIFRVTVSSLNDLGQVTYSKTSGVKSYNFSKDEELLCLSVDKKATMPLRISLNVLYYTPRPELSVGNLLHIPLLQRDPCKFCLHHSHVTAMTSVTSPSDTEDDEAVSSRDVDHHNNTTNTVSQSDLELSTQLVSNSV